MSRAVRIRCETSFSYPGYTRAVRRKLWGTVIPSEGARFLLRGTPHTRRYVRERLGWLPRPLTAVANRRPVWIHANSYGEVLASRPLIQALRRRWPETPLVVSTTNFTADTEAHAIGPSGGCDGAFFVPYDSPGIVARVLDRLRPRCLLYVEADLWPNLLRACAQRGVPSGLVSGRYMDLRYWFDRRFPLTGEVLAHVDRFCMQSEHEARQMRVLAPQASICVTGNLKMDRLKAMALTDPAVQPWGERLGLTGDAPVWVAGSVHPGEDELVLDAYLAARRAHPRLVLLLAPRYLEHAGRCEELAKRRGLRVVRRSALQRGIRRADEEVVLLDTLGELVHGYALGTVTFVGGSLVPEAWAPRGFECEGHNPLEPVVWGKPVVFGPRMGNFADFAQVCLDARIGWQVPDAQQLARRVVEVVGDPGARDDIFRRGKTLLARHPDVAQRTLEAIEPLVKGER